MQSQTHPYRGPDRQVLLTYITNLELEVDRLHRECRFMKNQLHATLKWVRSLSSPGSASDLPLAEINRAAEQLMTVLRDLQETPSYHPARDQVVAIAVKPLIERIFRLEQRLEDAGEVRLRLDLTTDHLDWFPARLRHILDTLIANALRHRDGSKAENWVEVGLKSSPEAYELSISDNGLGLAAYGGVNVLDLFYRAAPGHDPEFGIGLAVVKLLVEQSGGRLTVNYGDGKGSTFIAVLPRFDVSDYLT